MAGQAPPVRHERSVAFLEAMHSRSVAAAVRSQVSASTDPSLSPSQPPNEATNIARGTARTAPGALTDAAVISQMWEQFANLSAFATHALDTTVLTLDETVRCLRLAVTERRLLLASRPPPPGA